MTIFDHFDWIFRFERQGRQGQEYVPTELDGLFVTTRAWGVMGYE